jgi:hypothetical protein
MSVIAGIAHPAADDGSSAVFLESEAHQGASAISPEPRSGILDRHAWREDVLRSQIDYFGCRWGHGCRGRYILRCIGTHFRT